MQGNAYVLVMEYVEGGSLYDALSQDNSALMWAGSGRGRQLAMQIADALEYLHDNKVRSAQQCSATGMGCAACVDAGHLPKKASTSLLVIPVLLKCISPCSPLLLLRLH